MKIKPYVLVGAMLATLIPTVSPAQLVTFDPSNFMQNLQQVIQMGTELQQLRDQLEQMKQLKSNAESQLKSMTGTRNLGSIVTDTNRGYMNGIDGTSPQLSALMAQIKAKAGYLSSQDMGSINAAYRSRFQAMGDQAAQAEAMNTLVFQHSGEQFRNIQVLMDRISQTKDPKEIEDLQARIQSEQTMLQNEAIQASAMAAALQNHERTMRAAAQTQAAAQRVDYYKGGQ